MTSTRLTRQMLEQRLDQLDLALFGANEGVWDWDLTTNQVYFSPEWVRMLGYQMDELQPSYDEWAKRVHPEDMVRVEQVLQDHLQGRTDAYLTEHRLRRKDGSWRWILDRGKIVARDEQGNPLRMCGTHTDITEIKEKQFALETHVRTYTAELERLNHSLRETEQRQAALLNNIPDIAWLKDAEGHFIAANQPFAQACGWTPQTLVGKTDLDIWPRDLAELYRADDAEVMRSRQVKRVEEPIADVTGKSVWIETIKTPVLNEHGEVIGTVGIARDISERKQLDDLRRQTQADLERLVQERTEALAQKNRELQTSEMRNQAIVDAIPDLMFRLDRTGKVLDFKASQVQDLLRMPNRIIGESLRDILPSPVANLALEKIATTLATRTLQTFEYELPLQQGTQTFEARLVVSDVTGAADHSSEVLAIVRNISERAVLEQMKSDFINRAAHELRTPLTTVMMMADLIQEGGTPEELDEYWQVMQRELKRQRILVEKLLAAGRLEKGNLQIPLSPIELSTALHEAQCAVALQAEAKQIEMQVEIANEPMVVSASTESLQQVFVNLLGNAIKFTPARGRVYLRAHAEGDGVTIQVSDSGMGIPSADLSHLFTRFFRAQNAISGEVPGSGIGLYIVKGIVEKLGGHIQVVSELNHGATFTVWLPLRRETRS